MGLTELAIRRPVTTVMMVLMVLFLGTIALVSMPSDLLPEITMPAVAVFTEYPGAGPREVENLVTRAIEEACGAVGGVLHVASESSEGLSLVLVEFTWGTDMDMAALEIREAIDHVRDYLPGDASSPMVIKTDPAMLPIMRLTLSGPYRLVELTSMAELVQGRLERVRGVASVGISGGIHEEVVVEPDPVRLDSYGLTLHQISSTLRTENVSLPGGHVVEAGQRLTLRTVGEFTSLADIESVGIRSPLGVTVSLGDISRIALVEREMETLTRLNERPAVTMSVREQSGANTVMVARDVHRVLDEMRDELPSDVEITVVRDQSDFINRSIASVGGNVLLGGLLAVTILYLFLTDIRTVLVIGLAIPISVVATFAFMFFSGLTLNLVSLGGLALGVGMLVDNAIVILENIFRHREAGLGRTEAAVVGTREVAGAVTASTITTVVVFLPVVFMEGLAAQLFRQLSMTISFSLASSLLVSLTFVPMAASILFRTLPTGDRGLARYVDRFHAGLRRGYSGVLDASLRRRPLVVASVVLLFGAAVLWGSTLPRLFLPDMDMREIDVEVFLPRGTALERTDRIMEDIEDLLRGRDDVEFAFVTAGRDLREIGTRGASPDVGAVLLRLVPHENGLPTTYEVMDELRLQLGRLAGAETRVSLAPAFVGQDQLFAAPVVVSVLGDDLDVLVRLADDVKEIVDEVPGTIDVRTSWEESAPEVRLVVDRVRAAGFGLTSGQVAMMVRAAVEGDVATRYRTEGRDIDVRVILPEEHRRHVSTVEEMTLLTPAGQMVSVSQLVYVEREPGPTAISRSDQARTVDVQADIHGRDLDSVMADIRARLDELGLPPGYAIEYGGETQEMMQAFGVLGWALMAGVVLVYMVLASQFESFLQPAMVMVTIPLALIGVVAALSAWSLPLSIPALIGVIGMAGIAVNNSIVMITYMNQLRADGLDVRQAAARGAEVRLRPVLMTSMTTILGLLPMSLETGAGAEMQNAMAASVLGGLLVSMILTLFMIPILYTLFLREGGKGIEDPG